MASHEPDNFFISVWILNVLRVMKILPIKFRVNYIFPAKAKTLFVPFMAEITLEVDIHQIELEYFLARV